MNAKRCSSSTALGATLINMQNCNLLVYVHLHVKMPIDVNGILQYWQNPTFFCQTQMMELCK